MINLAKLSFLVDIVQSDEKSLIDKKNRYYCSRLERRNGTINQIQVVYSINIDILFCVYQGWVCTKYSININTNCI